MISRFCRTLDTLLDQTVLFSYTNMGYTLRHRSWDPTDVEVDMSGKTCIVTGANSGLGFAVTERLAGLGASVTMVVRNRGRGQQARNTIIDRTRNTDIQLQVVDISSLAAVRQFAADFQERKDRLDVLINNAGVLLDQRRLSAEGIEMTFATNILGPFLLTNALIPLLKHSAPARIIFVSSGGMYLQKLKVDDLQSQQGSFSGTLAYAQTKRAQVMLTELWAERLAGSGVTVNAMHPGWVDTPGVQTSLPTFRRVMRLGLRTPAQGADTIIWLAVAPHLVSESGKFWFDRRERATHKLSRTKSTPSDYQRLWNECLSLSGLDPDKSN